ncbi:MAG: 3-oxoacyl-[acyl-carrier-protein] synthase III C-terminal domain-containing protein [Verrucomicrobiota bacterium]
MYLKSIATAVPETSITQTELWHQLSHSACLDSLTGKSRLLLKKILLGDSGINKRHLAYTNIESLLHADAGKLNKMYQDSVILLAQKALKNACEQAQTTADAVDALFVCTCTGYLCPGVSSYVAESLGMNPSIFLQDIVGLGCGAALPTLQAASHYLSANPNAKVAVVAVESCSAAFYLDDDPGVLISFCLFGDGAAASIWTHNSIPNSYHFHSYQSLHLPAHREKLRFTNVKGKLKNLLDRSVPELASQAVSQLYKQSFTNGSSTINPQILAHTGGKKVIEAIEENLLLEHPLDISRTVLQDYGNMSSPSVLFCLERALEKEHQAKELWFTSFGAGFTCYSARLSKI